MGESTFFFAQVRVGAVRAKSELSNQRWMVFFTDVCTQISPG
jgi:hypothetical protein